MTPPQPEIDLFERVERIAEQFMDVCAEERRLVDMLVRVRDAKARLVSTLATHATTAIMQSEIQRRLREEARKA